MAGINTVTAFFNQLDNVKTKLSFYNLWNLIRILQVKSDIGIFGHQFSFAHKAKLTAPTRRSGIFRIKTGICGKWHFTGINTICIVTQSFLHTLYFFQRNFRFQCHNLHLHLSGNKRNTVLRQILKITAHFGRSYLNLPHNMLLHFLHSQAIADILTKHFAYLGRSLIIILFQFLLRTSYLFD